MCVCVCCLLYTSILGFEQCDKNDASEWLAVDDNDPGYQILSDQEIADMVSEGM